MTDRRHRGDGGKARAGETAAGGDTTVVEFDSSSGGVVDAVTKAVVRRSGREPLELPPLQTVVDADALETLFGGRTAGHRSVPRDLTVSFAYAGHRITVSGGRVVVADE